MKLIPFALLLPHATCFVFQMQDKIPPSYNAQYPRLQSRWNEPFSTAKRGLKNMMHDGIHWSTTLERTALRFLYVKNVFEISPFAPNDEIRKQIISALLNKPPNLDDKDDVLLYARARLLRLFVPESRFADNVTPSNVLSYEAFVRYTPAWKGPDSYVFFTDESWRWTMQIRQRVQEVVYATCMPLWFCRAT